MDSTDTAVLTAITVVFTISGLLAIAASLFNWNWFSTPATPVCLWGATGAARHVVSISWQAF